MIYRDQRTLDTPAVIRGREALKASAPEWMRAFEDLHRDLDELIDAGDRVISVGRWRGTGKESGLPTELSEAIVWTIRAGKITEGRAFSTRAEVLQRPGLRGS